MGSDKQRSGSVTGERSAAHLGTDIRAVIGEVSLRRDQTSSDLAKDRFKFLSNLLLVAADLADDIEGSPSGPPIMQTEFADTIFEDLVSREFPDDGDSQAPAPR